MTPSTCEFCRRAELTQWQRIREDLASLFRRPDPIGPAVRSMAMTLNAFTGRKPITAEEMHRERWVRTGDEIELRRMLRHQGELQ